MKGVLICFKYRNEMMNGGKVQVILNGLVKTLILDKSG